MRKTRQKRNHSPRHTSSGTKRRRTRQSGSRSLALKLLPQSLIYTISPENFIKYRTLFQQNTCDRHCASLPGVSTLPGGHMAPRRGLPGPGGCPPTQRPALSPLSPSQFGSRIPSSSTQPTRARANRRDHSALAGDCFKMNSNQAWTEKQDRGQSATRRQAKGFSPGK